MVASTSGTYNFSPSVSDLILDAYARIQIFAPAIQIHHIVEARRSLNLWLQDVAGNAGINLFTVDLIGIPLTPGQVQFPLPANTVEILDVYLRTFTPDTDNYVSIGNVLTAIGPAGSPLVAQPYGDPLLIAPGSGTLSSTAGSQVITYRWPNHGLTEGDPIFWECPVSVGGLAISGLSIVSTVVDHNIVQFLASTVALETQVSQGGTPLLSTNSGSDDVGVILPGHSLALGDTFTVDIEIEIGGFTLAAGTSYTVTAVNSSYEFEIQPGGTASATESAFLNDGQLSVTSQASSSIVYPQDTILFPLSRNDYAAIPQKFIPGRPTSFWAGRVVPPNFSIYPVAPAGSYYALMAHRMRQIQDANPLNGQTPDLPLRFHQAMTAALCAACAEKFRPEKHAEKLALAEVAWMKASSADVEHAVMVIAPTLRSYYR